MAEKFDYVITPIETEKGRQWRCYIEGRDDVQATGFSPTDALRSVNIQLWSIHYENRARLDASHKQLTRAIRKRAGLPSWALGLPRWVLRSWKRNERNRLHAVMKDIIVKNAENFPGQTYEEATEMALKEFNRG